MDIQSPSWPVVDWASNPGVMAAEPSSLYHTGLRPRQRQGKTRKKSKEQSEGSSADSGGEGSQRQLQELLHLRVQPCQTQGKETQVPVLPQAGAR